MSLGPENNFGFSAYVIDFFITEEIFEAVFCKPNLQANKKAKNSAK